MKSEKIQPTRFRKSVAKLKPPTANGSLNRCAGLHGRVVFLAEKGVLTAYDGMNHDELRAWLRSF